MTSIYITISRVSTYIHTYIHIYIYIYIYSFLGEILGVSYLFFIAMVLPISILLCSTRLEPKR